MLEGWRVQPCLTLFQIKLVYEVRIHSKSVHVQFGHILDSEIHIFILSVRCPNCIVLCDVLIRGT